ncbi:MAG: hypothetical protein Q7J73_09410 [Dehalococcoidales bacterium]|nr:hypothetical protein [Dehalococcoidales bacterium]
MKRYFAIMISAVLLLLSTTQYASAAYYAGDAHTNAYGAKANIFTPSSAPYIGCDAGQSNWVGTAAIPDEGIYKWIQTGWVYASNSSDAHPFVEVLSAGGRTYQEYGTQSWGTYKNYKVKNVAAQNDWSAYIDDVLKVASINGVPNGPQEVKATSEVHWTAGGTPNTTLSTNFSNVQYMNNSWGWNNFNGYWYNNSPYTAGSYYYDFRAYGPN